MNGRFSSFHRSVLPRSGCNVTGDAQGGIERSGFNPLLWGEARFVRRTHSVRGPHVLSVTSPQEICVCGAVRPSNIRVTPNGREHESRTHSSCDGVVLAWPGATRKAAGKPPRCQEWPPSKRREREHSFRDWNGYFPENYGGRWKSRTPLALRQSTVFRTARRPITGTSRMSKN